MPVGSDDYAGTGALSGNWTVLTGAASRVAGVLTATSAFAATWNAATFAADQHVEATLSQLPVNGTSPTARLTAGFNGYAASALSTGVLRSVRLDAGVQTVLETISGYTFVAGDTIAIRIVGSSVRLFYNGVAQGSGATDATYSAAASPGILLTANGDTADAWIANDIANPPPGDARRARSHFILTQ